MSKFMNETVQTIPMTDRYSVVEINSLLFGVEIIKSREVFPLPDVTPVPNAAEFVLGVFNLRGDIYPLLDISLILGMEKKPILPTDMVILLEAGNRVMGILTDRIHGIKDVPKGTIKSAHGLVPKKMENYLYGVVSDKSSSIFLLDVEQLFAAVTDSRFY